MFTETELKALIDANCTLQNRMARLYAELTAFTVGAIATQNFNNRVAARMSQLGESQAVAEQNTRQNMLQEMANLVDRINAAADAASPADILE